MLLSAVSVLVVAQSISEIPEVLMNNPVYFSIMFPSSRVAFTQKSLSVKGCGDGLECKGVIRNLNLLTAGRIRLQYATAEGRVLGN